MDQELINIRVEVDEETDLAVKRWAQAEGRSKRRHVAILVRKLTTLRKSHPDELQRLGLIDRAAVGQR